MRWRDASGTHRSQTFDRKTDAKAHDVKVKRAKQLGPQALRELERNQTTLRQYVNGGFQSHLNTLMAPTQRQYDWALDNHLLELVDEPLITLDVARLSRHRRYLLDAGRTTNTVRVAMHKLSGILQVAAEDGLIVGNPARSLRKLPTEPRTEPRALAPRDLETLVDRFTGRARVIVVLGWHLGLRPIEIRLVSWSSFDGDTLTIGLHQTKPSVRHPRTITVPNDAARVLRAWRLESGGRDEDPIVGPLSMEALRQWAYQHLKPAVRELTGHGDDIVTYTLRHSHASALHYAGFTVPEASKRLGHDAQTHLRHYAHVVESISGQRYADLDALIAAARSDSDERGAASS